SAAQGVVGDVKLDDRRDRERECRRVLLARRDPPRGRRPGRDRLGARRDRRRTVPDRARERTPAHPVRGRPDRARELDGARRRRRRRSARRGMTLETVLARLLSIGTAVATLAMIAGLCGVPYLLVAGIACMIALPAARVAVMAVA